MPLRLERTRDDIWIGKDHQGRVLGSIMAEGGGWWRGYLASGVGKSLWLPPDRVRRPEDEVAEVARRLLT